MRGALSIAFALCAAGGCSLGALDGYSNGATVGDPDASTDASANENDANGTSDGAAADADASTSDASGDASAPLDCSGGNYLFCTTFDDGMVANGWDLTFAKFGGMVSASNDARSGPFALRTQIPEMTATDNQYARLYKGFTGAKPIRVTFDIKIAMPAWQAASKAFSILEVTYPPSLNSSYLFRQPDGTTLSSEQNDTYAIVEDLPYAKWVRVAFEMVPTSPAGAMRLFYDGRKVYENTTVAFDAMTTPTTDVFVGLARFDPPSPAIDVLYDNVTMEQIP